MKKANCWLALLSSPQPGLETKNVMINEHVRRFVAMVLAVIMLGVVLSGHTQSVPERSISRLYHSAWTVKEDGPGQVSAITQTPDGYLWLGADSGLFRFDGIRFERFEDVTGQNLPSITIQSLYTAPDGALWIGFQRAGVSRWSQGRLVNYGVKEGLPTGTVHTVQADLDGVIWAQLWKGVYRLDQGHWQKVILPNERPRGAMALLVDQRGTLWVFDGVAIMRKERGATTFSDTGDHPDHVSVLAQDREGVVWMASARGTGGVRPVHGQNQAAEVTGEIPVRSAGMLFDREGRVWISTLGQGVRWYRSSATALARLRSPKPLEADDDFTRDQGLSSDYTWPIFQDREGNVWVGSSTGLDRFRPSAIVPSPFPRAMHDVALAVDADGTIWAGSTTHPLTRLQGDTLRVFDAVRPELSSAFKDRDGSLWFGGDNGIWHIEQGEPRLAAPAPAGAKGQVQAMTRDTTGALWVSGVGYPFSRYAQGQWHVVDQWPQLPRNEVPVAMATDTVGRIWLGYGNGCVYVIDGNKLNVYGANQGVNLGSITQILDTGTHLWIAGDQGLAIFDGQRLHRMAASRSGDLKGIAGMVEGPQGDLWLHTIHGVAHLPASQVQGFFRDPANVMQPDWLDHLDGLPGPPTQMRPLPSMVRGKDGRLWFATSGGVVWLDPQQIPRNASTPPVRVTSVIADGQTYSLAKPFTLPKGTVNLQIDYTATSFTIPERVRFHYRLDGVDKTWRDANTRRQAIYTNLPPGDYRFHVMASNNDGVWSTSAATVAFSIAPEPYQTVWFRLLCLLLLFLAAAAFYLWRMRIVADRVRQHVKGRTSERERIARELHDTLLQGVQGLLVRLESIAAGMDSNAPLRQSLNTSIQRARAMLIEGRDKIIALRGEGEQGRLSQALRELGDELAAAHGCKFTLAVAGVEVPLYAATAEEVLNICREALRNAFVHAQANLIQVEIEYRQNSLRVLIHDDGIGISPDSMRQAQRAGHWGVVGMHERAKSIDATLSVFRREVGGTTVALAIPGHAAFPPCTTPSG
ncbi:sensor histidine kinase [Dyella koreensis]|uniref:Histidine kinase/HSP90-like ATPase domain-containing protein n=1 Tax=Dyella koreensis TaxID=311235 RepID=A0ABW8K7S9_9GAMM